MELNKYIFLYIFILIVYLEKQLDKVCKLNNYRSLQINLIKIF